MNLYQVPSTTPGTFLLESLPDSSRKRNKLIDYKQVDFHRRTFFFLSNLLKGNILKNKGHLYFCENIPKTSTEEVEVPFCKTAKVKIRTSKTEYPNI